MRMNGVSVMVIAIMLFSSVGLCFANSAVEDYLIDGYITFWSGPFEYEATINYEDIDKNPLYEDYLKVSSGAHNGAKINNRKAGADFFNLTEAKNSNAFYYVLTLNPKNSRSDDWNFTYQNSVHMSIDTCMVVDANGNLGSNACFDWIIRGDRVPLTRGSHHIG